MYDIEVKQMSVYYGPICALDNININIKEKEFLGIIGPNGGGKTTFLKAVLGFIKPWKGSANIKENKIIGYVPQYTTFQRNFPINVKDVVLMGKRNKGTWFQKYSHSEVELAKQTLDKLGLLSLQNRQVGELSGGQLQKVLIARALMMNPEILVLDEPNANLDKDTRKDILDILKEFHGQKTILMVTHNVEDIVEYIDRLAYVNQTLEYYQKNEVKYEDIIKRNMKNSFL